MFQASQESTGSSQAEAFAGCAAAAAARAAAAATAGFARRAAATTSVRRSGGPAGSAPRTADAVANATTMVDTALDLAIECMLLSCEPGRARWKVPGLPAFAWFPSRTIVPDGSDARVTPRGRVARGALAGDQRRSDNARR